MLEAIVIGLISVGTLTVNHKWAGIDPHNPAAGPSWLEAALSALGTMALLCLALELKTAAHPDGAAFVGALTLGFGLGPSISTPNRLTKEEEPSWLGRFLEGRRVSLGGGLLKSLILIPLTPIVAVVVSERAAFWAAGILAAFLGVLKAPTLMLLLQEPKIAADYASSGHRLIGGSVLLSCCIGTVALGAWLSIILPLIELLPVEHFHDYLVAFGGFLIGLMLHAP